MPKKTSSTRPDLILFSHKHNPTFVLVNMSAVGSQVRSAASAPSVLPRWPIIDPTFCLSN